MIWCFCGPTEQADEAFAPALEVAEPLLHAVAEMPYPTLQSAFDELYPPRRPMVLARATPSRTSPDEAIALHVEFSAPPPLRAVRNASLPDRRGRPPRGAGRQPRSATETRTGRWSWPGSTTTPGRPTRCASGQSSTGRALHPFSEGGAYVNFMIDEGQERVTATYRDNYRQLARDQESKYDPDNFFHVNQNIRPAARR